ncbi:single-strand DNA-binding protein [Mycetocola sp. CAN_C7]|uniref:single-stranded DNA-binding protein n=1 Tax=Mycetocola sp. CAN_C7 TaxID=2787724 RepID=UPI0018C910E5
MTDTITLTGLVATVPYTVDREDKVPFTSFRLASSQRYFDRRTSQWVAGDTNWYTVTSFRALATNTAASVHKGDRVLVTGRLRIRRWESGEKNGLAVDVEADSIGHDLVWGTAKYSRVLSREATASESGQQTVAESLPDAVAADPAPPDAGVSSSSWPVTEPGRPDAQFAAPIAAGETPF